MKKIVLSALFTALLFAGCNKDDDSPQTIKLEDPKEEEKPEDKPSDDTGSTPDATMNIFLCFGQSNMEGNAAIEEVDKSSVPLGMKNMIVANCDVTHYAATRYTWRKADPPLARFNTGLTPADYFGRTMMQYLPAGNKVGIVMVAIGGAAIEAFDKDKYKEYYDNISDADAWLRGYMDEYDGNPYKTLVTAAKAAQKAGVIRGILLHQGESNNCQADWPDKVKKIYNDLLADLNLTAEECPLLVGETLRQAEGGVCYGHNDVIARVPDVIPTAHVISSEGCKGKSDGLHFLASGYRVIGKRYAEKMLELMQISMPNSEYNGFYVEGRYLMDKDGNQVNLHGFCQTYSPWFNEQGSKWNGNDVTGCLNYNQGLIRTMMSDGWNLNFIRLHMDPHWTMSNQPAGTQENAAYKYYDEEKFRKYLDEVFVPMAKFCIDNYQMAVVMRPPGVCPENLKAGDAYQKYLLNVWNIVSSHSYLRNNPYVMFELANEPISFTGGDQAYSKYFQDVVDMIRVNCDNVVWAPGLAWQQNYKPFAAYPLQGKNIGYAVHCYPGWYGSPAENQPGEFSVDLNGNETKFRAGWAENVGCVADFAPIMITEMDWSPLKYNKVTNADGSENAHYVAWGSSTTTAFGAPFKKIADEYGNVSWLLFTSPHLLAKYKNHDGVDDKIKGFLEDPEACPTACYNWFKEYGGGIVDHGDVVGIEVTAPNAVMQGSTVRLSYYFEYSDGYKQRASADGFSIYVKDDAVMRVLDDGTFETLQCGVANIEVSYESYSTVVSVKVVGPFDFETFNPSIYETGTFDIDTKTFVTGRYGFAGWEYSTPIDLSSYRYLVVEMEDCPALTSFEFSFRLFDQQSYWSKPATIKFEGGSTVTFDFSTVKNENGEKLDLSHIYRAGFWTFGDVEAVIKDIRLEK